MNRRAPHFKITFPIISIAALFALIPFASCDCGLDPLDAVPGRIAGVLCDPLSGNAAPALDFTVTSPDGREIDGSTDETGNFLVEGVAAGKAVVHAGGRDIDVVVEADATATVTDLACRNVPPAPGTGDIAGTICNRHTGGVVAGADVIVTLTDGTQITGTTDDNGSFRLFNVPAGPQVITVDGPGFRRTWRVEVPNGGTVEIPSEGDCTSPDLNSGMLSGIFCDEAVDDGTFLTGATVTATDATGEVFSDLTDVDGAFIVGPMAPGLAAVTVVREPDVHLDYTVIIVGGQEAQLTNGGACVPETCEERDIQSDGRTELMFVVDRSGSMNAGAPGYPGTRWEGMTSSIETVTADLQSRFAFGVSLYPAIDSNECEAGPPSIAPAFDDADDINTLLGDFYTEPAGATPTAAALTSVRDWHVANPTDRKRAVLLATDGAPNCNDALDPATCACSTGDDSCAVNGDAYLCLDEQGSVDAVTALHDLGLDVYVIGIAGVEGFGYVMDEMAAAGGTERHYVARDTDSLREAMVDVARRAGGCSIETDRDLSQIDDLDIVVDGTFIRHGGLRGNDGYDIVDDHHIELYGAACEAFLTSGDAHIKQCTLDEPNSGSTTGGAP